VFIYFLCFKTIGDDITLNREQLKARMGWIKQEHDSRDYTPEHPKVKAVFDNLKAQTLPLTVDLRLLDSPVEDQGNLGSCTANAEAGDIQFLEKKQNNTFIDASRLFIYYNTRHLLENTSGDVGATIRDTIKSVVTYGACKEDTWPYIEGKYDTKPLQSCYDEALNYQTLTYVALKTLADIQTTLAGGLPVQIGILVFESFENVGSDGIVPMPKSTEELLGSHAVLVVGYKVINGILYLIVRNSWSANWGDHGYFYLPTAYLTKKYSDGSMYSDDWWVILTEEYIQNPSPGPSPGASPQPDPDIYAIVMELDSALPLMKKSTSKNVKQAMAIVNDCITKLSKLEGN